MTNTAFMKIVQFLDEQPVVTLSTTNDDTTPYGSIIYLFTLDDERLYFITRKATQKYQNLLARPVIGLTSASDDRSTTLQATGQASEVTNPGTIKAAKRKLVHVHPHKISWAPPVIQLEAGEYVIIAVDLMSARLGIFSKDPDQDPEIYTYVA